MSGIKAFLEQLKNTVVDFSELNVRTFEGSIEAVINADGGTPISDDLNNIDELLKQGVISGQLKLMAYTVHKLDKDVDQYFDTNIQADLKIEHQQTVKASQEARAAVFTAIMDNFDI